MQDLELPVLSLYGGADWISPPVENAEKLRGLFKAPDRVTVHVFPDADHRLELPSGTDSSGQWQWPRVAPDLESVVIDWLDGL